MTSYSTKPLQLQACDSWKKSNFARSILTISDAQLIEDFLRLDSFGSRPDLVRQDSVVWPGARHSPFALPPSFWFQVGRRVSPRKQKPHRPGSAPALGLHAEYVA
jgi:hypothetical protein